MKEIYENAIYQHFKHGHYYKVILICYLESFGDPYIVYNRCDEKGIFLSIREYHDAIGTIGEKIVKQPFLRSAESFASNALDGVERFKFVKHL